MSSLEYIYKKLLLNMNPCERAKVGHGGRAWITNKLEKCERKEFVIGIKRDGGSYFTCY